MMQAQRSLKDQRQARGLTQAELAERAGIARTTVYRIESARTTPSIGTLRLITDALNVRPEGVAR